MRKKKIKIPIYFGDLLLYEVDSLNEIAKKYELEDMHKLEACVLSAYTKNGYSAYIMAFEKGVSLRVVAHEATHAVNKIFKDRLIRLDVENDEPQCYLLGWIFDKCCEFLHYN